MTPEQFDTISGQLVALFVLGLALMFVLGMIAWRVLDEIEEFRKAILERMGPKP